MSSVDTQQGVVIKLDRGFPLIELASGEQLRAEHATALIKEDQALRAAVGDNVVLDLHDGHDKAIIQEVLPRTNELVRWEDLGSSRGLGSKQVLAANVDVAIFVIALRKKSISFTAQLTILRALVMFLDAGLTPLVVLTKADLKRSPDDLEHDIELVRELIGTQIDVLAVSAMSGEGIDKVAQRIPRGTKAVLLGESGVGKSTLVNALTGTEHMKVGAVRTRDGAGRHTTVSRQLVELPSGGKIVDTPGVRTLVLAGFENGLHLLFSEIDAVQGSCKFNDCSHTVEPGCAVLSALEAGEVSTERFSAYQQLAAELADSRERLERLGVEL